MVAVCKLNAHNWGRCSIMRKTTQTCGVWNVQLSVVLLIAANIRNDADIQHFFYLALLPVSCAYYCLFNPILANRTRAANVDNFHRSISIDRELFACQELLENCGRLLALVPAISFLIVNFLAFYLASIEFCHSLFTFGVTNSNLSAVNRNRQEWNFGVSIVGVKIKLIWKKVVGF